MKAAVFICLLSALLLVVPTNGNGQCQTITGVGKSGCNANAYSGTVHEDFTVQSYKKGYVMFAQLLQMVKSLGFDLSEDCLTAVEADVCHTILPPCTKSCKPQKLCPGSCESLKTKCLGRFMGQLTQLLPGNCGSQASGKRGI